MAPSTGIEPATSCSTGSRPLQGTTRARRRKRDGGAPGRIRTSTAAGHGVTARWARLCPSRRSCHHAGDVWLAMPLRFSMCGSRILRAKRKGPGVARPLVGSLFNRGSSSCSHRGDSGPGDARLGSYPRTDVLAGYIGAGRRPQPSFRLRVPNPSSFCL